MWSDNQSCISQEIRLSCVVLACYRNGATPLSCHISRLKHTQYYHNVFRRRCRPYRTHTIQEHFPAHISRYRLRGACYHLTKSRLPLYPFPTTVWNNSLSRNDLPHRRNPVTTLTSPLCMEPIIFSMCCSLFQSYTFQFFAIFGYFLECKSNKHLQTDFP